MSTLLLALVLAATPGPTPVQDSGTEGKFALEVRVASAERGWARIDRGSADGLLVGDVVTFLPREGGVHPGTVTELEERAARVELGDPAFVPAAGTRGRVQIPRSRLDGGSQVRPRKRPAAKRPAGQGEPPPPAITNPTVFQNTVFQNRDEGWQEGEPLLARVRAVRPEERAASIHGRSYASFDATRASEGDRSDGFLRLGTGLVLENPFGRGDRLHADLEWNARRVVVDDLDGEENSELRLDRLSYAWGGTRFAAEGWEVGRFLPNGVPELGVLDGVERIVRKRGGDRYGASLGFLPEPDQEFQSGSDFQLAAFYRWVADESEELSASAAYQKTFHNGAADRDLVVTSFSRIPRAGWSLFGTAWIDFYTAGDDQKGTLLGLTQAYLGAGRRWQSGSSFDLILSHLEFPEIDRNEFLPVEDAQLADDHNERLALTSKLQLTRDLRLLSGVGGWVDEDEAGADAELGLALRDFVVPRAFGEFTAFGTRGRFQTSLGARASLGIASDHGRWALDYELSQNRLDGFSATNDDLPQHRLRFHYDHAWHGWDLSWRLEGLVYDDENAVSVGLYLQRSHY